MMVDDDDDDDDDDDVGAHTLLQINYIERGFQKSKAYCVGLPAIQLVILNMLNGREGL